MEMALSSKNKLQFVDGSLPSPAKTDPMFVIWNRCNTTVAGWLTRSMTSSIAQSVLWMNNAAQIWEDLKVRFAHHDKFRIADLQEQLFNCKQGELSISEYYT